MEQGKSIPVNYHDEAAFRQWSTDSSGPVTRMNGRLTLLGLRPLVKAEIKRALFHHTQRQFEGGRWPLPWIQYLINACRDQAVDSLIGFDYRAAAQHPGQVARVMLEYLRQVCFTRADTKDAGFIEPGPQTQTAFRHQAVPSVPGNRLRAAPRSGAPRAAPTAAPRAHGRRPL
ncbi:hypothetical protein ACIRS3_34820 [Streptomyces virginiae]|uniref:hypothetical protein n=1 Tax=Streptomyces virginiae TaxID=1961 RepID=UPI0037FCC563